MESKISISPDKALAELGRRSFYDFLKMMWGEIIPDDFQDNWHIRYLCDELQVIGERVINREAKEYDLVVNVPPGTSKSTICTIMFPAWLWVRDASLKFITSSYSYDLSISHSLKSRDLLKSDKFKKLYGHLFQFKSDNDNKGHFENTKGGARITTSTGGTITGMHGHLLVVDDPLNPRKAASEVERNSANEWISTTLSTRKIDKAITPTILIMQRLHEFDCTGYLLSKTDKKIKHICLPAELTNRVSPLELRESYKEGLLDPVRLSAQVLEESKIDLGSFAYAGQFLQSPAPEDGGIIKKEWFDFISPVEFDELIKGKNPVFNSFVDPAYTASKQNDPTALLSCTKIGGYLYINDVVEKWFELPELIRFIKEFALKNNHDNRSRIYIEPKASGKSIVQALKSEAGFNVIESEPPKDDKVTRAHSITALIESGKCILVGSKNTTWIETFLNQCGQFPNAKHDDMIDCLIMACNGMSYKKYNGKYSIH